MTIISIVRGHLEAFIGQISMSARTYVRTQYRLAILGTQTELVRKDRSTCVSNFYLFTDQHLSSFESIGDLLTLLLHALYTSKFHCFTDGRFNDQFHEDSQCLARSYLYTEWCAAMEYTGSLLATSHFTLRLRVFWKYGDQVPSTYLMSFRALNHNQAHCKQILRLG